MIETISDVLRTNRRRFGRRIAVQEMASSGELRGFSYADFARQVDSLTILLQGKGVGPGDRAALVMPNGRPWVAAYFAGMQAGAILVPLEYDFLEETPEYLRFPLQETEPEVVMVHPRDASAVAELCPDGTLLIAVDEEVLAEERPSPSTVQVDPEDTAQILYTSGTTGRRKGVVLTHRNVTRNVQMCCERFGVAPDDSLPALLPHHHAYPLTTTVVLPLYSGARMTVGHIRRKNVHELLPLSRPTVLVGVPRVFESLLSGIERTAEKKGKLETLRRALSWSKRIKRWTGLNVGKVLFKELHRRLWGGTQLRFCVSGGARLPSRIVGQYLALGVPLVQGWGMTELSPVGAAQEYSPARFYFTRHYERKAGSVGTPLPGTEIHLADCPEEDVLVERDGKGEMVVRGPHVMDCYYADEEATRCRKTDSGLRSGDIAREDGDGNLYIVGRAKHVIVLPSGKKVFPEEDLYEELRRCPTIEEFTVRAISSEEGEEKIGIIIKPDAEELAVREVSTFGEVYGILNEEIRDALQHKPAFMRTYDFCLTPFNGEQFDELVKNTMGEPGPHRNEFRQEAAWSSMRDSDSPIALTPD